MTLLPLDGIRVLDLSWVIAGPTAARALGAMGAEVIKVGSDRRPDPAARAAAYQSYNQSKLHCALNLSKPEGLDLARRLVAISDVLIENFATGVIDRLGLGYEDVREVKPDIVMISSSGLGHTGPHKDHVAYGSLLQYYTGWGSISGYPDGEPARGGTWCDPWAGMELAMITVAALYRRGVTGLGEYIDYSMAEGLVGGMPEALLDHQMNGRVRAPNGNRDDQYAPHGLYRCLGDDRWLAIAVTDDDEWRALCGVIERPELAAETRFAAAAGRRAGQDEIDAAIAAWTATQEDYGATALLQEAGVPAGPSLDLARVPRDPHLRARGYFRSLRGSDGVTRELPGLPWLLGDDEPVLTPAPTPGQHNDYVYGELLGLSGDEIARLVDEQVIY